MRYKGIRKTKTGRYNSFFYYDDDEKFECSSDCEEIELAMFWLLWYVNKFEKANPETVIYFTSKKQELANKRTAARRKHRLYQSQKDSKNGKKYISFRHGDADRMGK